MRFAASRLTLIIALLVGAFAVAHAMGATRGSRRSNRGAIYARQSTDEQTSLPDQIRECREWAARHGIEVPDDMVFTDKGKSGRTHKRPGLDALNAALNEGKADNVIVFQTSRLYRRLYLVLQFMAERILDKRRRIVFVTQNVDTATDDRWKYLVPVLGMIDELRLGMTTGNIHAAHKGLHRQGKVWGTRTFGYRGREVEGEQTKKGTARRVWEIDPVEAKWVAQVFEWFVDHEIAISEIVRRLNGSDAPLPPKCITGGWTTQAVSLRLKNERYRGIWQYGVHEAVWQHGAGYSRQFERETPLDEQQFEDLRLVDDTTWWAAQDKLASYRDRAGRRAAASDAPGSSRLINKLCVCEAHEQRMWVSGTTMYCPVCRRSGEPALVSVLPLERATRMVLETVADLLRSDTQLVARAVESCKRFVRELKQPDAEDLDRIRKDIQGLTTKIKALKSAPAGSDEDLRENPEVIAELEPRRGQARAELARLEGLLSKPIVVPSTDEVRRLIDNLADTLVAAASSDDERQTAAARRILMAVTGGRILITQQGERKAKRGWLRGSFQVDLLASIASDLGLPATAEPTDGRWVHIDFKAPTLAEQVSETAKALADQGMLIKDIAAELSKRQGQKVSRNLVTRALQHWYESRGLSMPDGRQRRAELGKLSFADSKCGDAQVIEQVMALFEAGRTYRAIAEAVQIHEATVAKIVRQWHEERGMPVPDGRARRRANRKKESDDTGPAAS